MKLKESLVSVILPVYNAGKFLPICLETLINQSYPNIEIIAVDDRSKDNSLKILKQFKKRFKNILPGQRDARNSASRRRGIQILQNKKHYGPAVCLNRAIRIAQGQFITFMNPYDYISIHKFKRQINLFQRSAKTVAVGTQYVAIDENNKTLEKSALSQDHDEIYNALLHSFPLKPETVMINRMLLPKDLLFFTTNKYPLLYTEVFIKLLRFGKITNLSQSFYRQRVGIRRYTRRHSKMKQTFSLLQLLLKARSAYDYRPSIPNSLPVLKSLLQPRLE